MKNTSFFPEEIIFAATDACNLHCPHCYVSRTPNKINIEKAKNFILSSLPQIQRIGFSGGEPFLYKDFLFEIIGFAVKNDLMFDQIMTNGDWWTDEKSLNKTLQQLYDSGYDGKIGLSWDSFHGQSVERMKIFINSVQNIFGQDSINIQFVEPYNKGESLPLTAASEESSVTPSAGTPRNAPVTQQEIQNLFPEIPVYILPQSFTGNNPFSWQAKKWFKDDFCQGPGQILYIHPDGRIAPCCGFANENKKLIIGSIDDPFNKIMENAEENPMIALCYEQGLSKAVKLLKKQKITLPGKCNDICSFCDFVCKNLNF